MTHRLSTVTSVVADVVAEIALKTGGSLLSISMKMGGYLLGSFPTLQEVDWIRLRGVKTETYTFHHYRCKGGTWGIGPKTPPTMSEPITSRGEWRETREPWPKDKDAAALAVREVFETHASSIDSDMARSPECMSDILRCKCGEQVKRGRGKTQKCEDFHWEHESRVTMDDLRYE
jgi:hypothetical protein